MPLNGIETPFKQVCQEADGENRDLHLLTGGGAIALANGTWLFLK